MRAEHNARSSTSAILRVVALAFAAAIAACSAQPAPDVVLISVDTLRADHLGAYASSARTPRLDAFASDAAVFERCAAPMPLTRPSHFSMLTGRYPREHGVTNNELTLPDEAATLTEMLAAQGYRTAAFVAVRLLGSRSGAQQGFEHFDEPARGRERRAESVVPAALAWTAELPKQQPFFLWMHLFDAHMPYAPPLDYRSADTSRRPELSWEVLMQIASENGGDIPAAILEEAKQLYRAEVAYLDHWIGEFLDTLARQRSLDDTLIVLTADHGECFSRGIYFDHADCLWQEAIRVPLLIRYPRQFEAGSRVAAQASLVDLAPTIERAVARDGGVPWSGHALQNLRSDRERAVLIQHPWFDDSLARRWPQRFERIASVAGNPLARILLGGEKVGLVSREWTFLRGPGGRELYALAPSIDEDRNRADQDSELASRLEAALEAELVRHPQRRLGSNPIEPELQETLRALGYL
jgi:arylsulfatase A-like enzyme